ncbi:MAG: hypothetical protein IT337_05640, partial [Thermomicrobiales bacterium]|nr:hypothetical protein [Thermomicrobiales bacterium]
MRTAVRRVARCAGSLALAAALSAAAIGAPAQAQQASPAGPALVATGEPVLLRAQPGYDAAALTTLGQGDSVEIVGPAATAPDGAMWLPVAAMGQTGYLPAGVVAASAEPEWAATAEEPLAPDVQATADALSAPADAEFDPAPPAPSTDPAASSGAALVPAGAAITTSDVNLRAGPSGDDAVLLALPPGTNVLVDGTPIDGYAP